MKDDIRMILKNTALESTQAMTKSLSAVDMFKKGQRERTFILMMNWICAIVFIYVLLLNVNDLTGDIFINSALTIVLGGLGSIFSNVLIYKIGMHGHQQLFKKVFKLYNRLFAGRRKTLMTSTIGSGVICLLMALLPKSHTTVMLLLFLTGRILSESSGGTCWFYTAELYPTNLRSQALGLCSSFARYILPFKDI